MASAWSHYPLSVVVRHRRAGLLDIARRPSGSDHRNINPLDRGFRDSRRVFRADPL